MRLTRGKRRATHVVALALIGGLLISGICDSQREAEPASASVPPAHSAQLIARTDALRALALRLSALEGTPLSRWAAALSASLPDCPIVSSRAARGEFADLWTSIECHENSPGAPDPLEPDEDVRLTGSTEDGAAVATLRLGAGGNAVLDLQVPRATGGLVGFVLPGSEAAGAAELSGSDALIHARIRPAGGLDLAALVPSGSQGAQLFRLKSELFAGLVLAGVWEVAVYLPAADRPMPRAALALEFSHRGAAIAAMEQYVAELESQWPVHRTFFRSGDAEGGCLLDLNLLPDLAPCYVATDRALVIGWNPASLRKARDGQAPGLAELGSAGGALVDFEKFPRADRILARATGAPTPPASRPLPWRRWVARAAPAGARYSLRVEMIGSDAP
jgi:hypothetical protein